jgi:hypothetical protein
MPLERYDWYMALALAVLLIAAGSAQMVGGVGGIYHDDGVYISTAKALAEGQGYRLINLPDAPVQTKYPLLYPALLALIWKLWPAFPDNLLAMQWLTLLLGAVTVGLAYLYMVRCHYFSQGIGVAATLLCTTAPFFLFFCTTALSEIPFALLMILAMWRLDKALALPAGRRSAQLVLGCLLALPFLTRPIGIVFAPVGLALLYGAGRPLRWVAVGAAAIMLPWMFCMLIGPHWHASGVTAYYTNYVHWWSAFGMPSFGRVVGLNVLYIFWSSADIGLGVFNTDVFFPMWAWPLPLLAGSGMYVALLRHLRQGRVLPCFLVAYVLVILVWPWPASRFLIPILPFLLAYLLSWVWNWLPQRSMLIRPLCLGLAIVSLLLSMNVGLVYHAMTISQRLHYPYFTRVEKPPSWSSYAAVFQWIKANTQPADVLACGLDSMLYLYTQRHAFRPFVSRPVSLFYGAHGPPLGPMEEIVAFLKAYKARYFVHLPMPGFTEEAPLSAFVRHAQEQYRGWLKPVYRGGDDRFVIFELQSDREPAAMPQHTNKAVLDADALSRKIP